MILQRAQHVTASHTIQRRIEKLLDTWEYDKNGMLVEDTLRTCADYFTVARREELAEHRAQKYHSLVLRGKPRTAVIQNTNQEMVGVLQPG